MKLLYGKPVAEEILTRLKDDIFLGVKKPGLAVILVGSDAASHIYVNLKEKAAKEIGINFSKFEFVEDAKEDEILEIVKRLNEDENINGIIVQVPLPQKFHTEKIISSIKPSKDVDGFHKENIEKFISGSGEIFPVFPNAILKLAKSSGENLSGKKALVVANSEEFGRIMCAAFEKERAAAEYILSHSISSNLSKIKGSDVVVSAVGSPGLLRGEMFKEGAIVIDGGIEKVGKKVLGDVDFASTEGKNGFLTPVPGGVGPTTIACLLENTFLLFKAQQKE